MKIFADEEKAKPLKSNKFVPVKEANLNIFILGRKKQGKSNLVANIIDMLGTKHTHLNYFQPTHTQDTTKLKSEEYFEGKGYQIQNHYSIFDDKGKNLITELQKEMEYLNLKNQKILENPYDSDDDVPDQNDKDEIKRTIKSLLQSQEEEKKKKRKPIFPPKPFQYCHFINVFDDLITNELPHLFQTFRTNRHYKLTNIVSHHDYRNGLDKKIRQNVDLLIIFPGQSDMRIQQIFDEFNPCDNFEKFLKIYKHATKDKYNFLTYDVQNSRLFHNFDEEYETKKQNEK